MAIPFTRWATFISQNVPKVTALFLNQWQDSLAAVAYPAYGRIPVTASCVNSSWVTFSVIPPYMALDAVTSQYVGVPAATAVAVNSGFVNGWNYIYVRASSGVAAYSVSTTAPEATLKYKTGDETYRYLCCVYVSSGSLFNFFVSNFRYVYGQVHNAVLAGTATSWTTLNLTGLMPPTTQRVAVYVENVSSGATAAHVRPTGSGWGTGLPYPLFATSTATNIGRHVVHETWTNTSNQIDYILTATGSVTIDVVGFTE